MTQISTNYMWYLGYNIFDMDFLVNNKVPIDFNIQNIQLKNRSDDL